MTADQGAEESRSTDSRLPLRLAAASLVLVAIAFVQEPGRVVADTKLDLVIAPTKFLGRALYLWDPVSAFGQLQNQAYGYFWPMGPVFLLGYLAEVPAWVVQRIWLSLVMVVAFVGLALLARALGVRSHAALIVAGFAYALSPRMLTTLGPISIEAWPSALAPWVLLPLVIGSQRGSTRRAAAFSALAIATVGGVNAAATFAVVPLGALWLLTRTPSPRRRSLMLWWPVMTLLGTTWWLIPLFTLGAYSPPFLDYIESASITTFPTALFDVLRGTSNWVPYLDQGSRAGKDLITTGYLILNTSVVVLLGALGVGRRDNPHRQFLALGALTGLVMVNAGHTGAVQGWFAAIEQDWLDGVLAPLRNVHKFDPVLRLPLALGLAFLLGALSQAPWGEARVKGRGTARDQALRARYAGVLALSIAAVVGSASPAWVGRIAPADSFTGVPDYWRETSVWLADHSDGTRALLVPASSFADYSWGETRDEPLQPLAESPWAVRNAIPLAPPGNIRMLDAVESRLYAGRPSKGLAPFLRRAGVGYLVVRNDLEPRADRADPVLVRQALGESPGIDLVREFGPILGGEPSLESAGGRVLINNGWQGRHAAVEIYRVQDASRAKAVRHPPVVIGGPEDLLRLADFDVLSDEPAILAADLRESSPNTSGPLILTDGLRSRQRHFGRLHDAVSATQPRGREAQSSAVRPDYEIAQGTRWKTTSVISGAEIRASSSTADVRTLGALHRGELPYAALDGHPETQWVSATGVPDKAWLEIRPEHPHELERIRLVAGTAVRPSSQRLRVRTNNGVSDVIELGASESAAIEVPVGLTKWIRIEDAGLSAGQQLAIAEVDIPHLAVDRYLEMPKVPVRWGAPDIVLAEADVEQGATCLEIDGDTRCAPERSRPGEEPLELDRILETTEAADYEPKIWATARPGESFNELVQRSQPINAFASSASVRDPRASAVAAVDGDPGTTWIAGLEDVRPTLRLNWLGRKKLTGISVSVDDATAARRPTTVRLVYPGGSQTVALGESGRARIDPIRTDRLSIVVTEAEPARDLQFDGNTSQVAIGMTEVRVAGLDLLPLRLPNAEVEYPCGTGPTVHINGRTRSTSVVASPRQLWAGEQIEAQLCHARRVALAPGRNRVRLEATPYFTADAILLRRSGAGPSVPSTVKAVTRRTSPTEIAVDVPKSADLVTLRQNVNPGWQGKLTGRTLSPVTVDGWQQGWWLNGRQGELAISYAPNATYQRGLAIGAVLFVLLLVAAGVSGKSICRVPEASAREIPVLSFLALGSAGAGLLAGWVGLAVFVVMALLIDWLGQKGVDLSDPVIVASIAVAAGWYWSGSVGDGWEWAGEKPGPQYLVIVILSAWFGVHGLGSRQFLRRMKGSSTKR